MKKLIAVLALFSVGVQANEGALKNFPNIVLRCDAIATSYGDAFNNFPVYQDSFDLCYNGAVHGLKGDVKMRDSNIAKMKKTKSKQHGVGIGIWNSYIVAYSKGYSFGESAR